MKPTFATRRKPRIVARSDEPNDLVVERSMEADPEPATVVKRPLKPKGRPSSRISFGPGGASTGEEDGAVFTPKKSSLSRQAAERSALRKSPLVVSNGLPTNGVPSYSKDDLNELKNSTPSTPKDYTTTSKEVDVASKFGTDLVAFADAEGNPSIPSDAVVAEKKARRKRLALERKHQADSDASDTSDHRHSTEAADLSEPSSADEFRTQADRVALSHHSRPKSPDTRLVREDEDFLEDFDAFVSDGRITLTRNAERKQRARRKEEMRELIADAEGMSMEEDSNDSERERREEYETAQTQRAMDGMKREESHGLAVQMPAKVTPLPSFAGLLERLQVEASRGETSRVDKVKRLEEAAVEKAELATRGEEIQKLLTEMGAEYEKLRAGLGLSDEGVGQVDGQRFDRNGQRGLGSV